MSEQDIRQALRAAIEALEAAVGDPALLEGLTEAERIRLWKAAGEVFAPDPEERRQYQRDKRRRSRAAKISADQAFLATSGIRRLRAREVFTTPNVFVPEGFEQHEVVGDPEFREVTESQHCYVCKEKYTSVHHFYDQLCPACAEFNYAKRTETADLAGRVALLTGGRVKIGYQAGIKLLRAGARLIVTTRFPRNAAARYAAEADFDTWHDRLEIFGLDLRHTPSVEAFCHHLDSTGSRLDFIVNNACQTVRRPPDFYRHMLAEETCALSSMAAPVRALLGGYEGLRAYDLVAEPLALLPGGGDGDSDGSLARELFPEGRLDQDLQQVDLRTRNSWRYSLDEVSAVELLETQLVNAVAPFVLNARLKPLMLKTPGREKHIVNVSAVEGQFYRRFKTTKHPHTNMAKAALNMMTRTAAAEYAVDGIHMNSVDTGWVTDEDPVEIADRKRAEQRFHPPLDIVDGAARIVDPIIDGLNTGTHVWGQFLKDYRPTDW